METAEETMPDAGPEDRHKREEPAERPPMPAATFMTLVAGLSTQVLMNLGEFENPATGGREVDLDHAKYTIDLLGVIQEKTRGNLTPEEKEILDLTLYELRMKYVSASNF